ncbi:MAG: sulfatase, partial [Acidobacteriota bacterium]
RSPESLGFDVALPANPWLHLAVGAVEEPAPSFTVTVTPAGGSTETVAELSVEAADRWQPTRVDLTAWAGQQVRVDLRSSADQGGTLAFWGAPTIRDAAPVAVDAPPRTVVVFLADTLRSDHLEAWGHENETAPTLTRLASEGVRFADTIAQATWTKASVSSMLTSLYPSTTGVTDLNDRVAAGETTLAEAFRAAGYATFATSSVPFSGQLTNLHQGVEVLYEFGANPGGPDGYQSKTAEYWVDAYLEWLDLHRDVPTFAFVHAMDPHSPFKPREPYDSLFTEEGGADRFAEQADAVRPLIKSPLLQRFMAPSRDELAAADVDEASFVAHEKAWYDGSIRGMDAQLERLVGHLDTLGLGDRSLVAFVTDHGEEFLDHGRHWHGMTVYGEVARVPWVLWGQGVPAGMVVEETVQNLDILPTLLDLSGLPIPERAQGRSLVPVLRGESTGRTPPAFTEQHARPRPDEWNMLGVVENGWKLVWNIDPPEGVTEYELYHVENDPLDQNDLAAEHPERVAEMAETARRWRIWAEAQKLDEAAAQAEMSAEELEQLRALGYVE